jgi:hypothetical protein
MTTDTVLFAEAPDGTRLPVIDLSLPQFAVPDSPQAVAELEAKALEEQRQRGPVQRAAMAVMLKAMAGQSRLIQALQDARGGFLSGTATYVMKLGADNLVPPYASEIDRRVAETPIVVAMRLRLAQVATLLSEALAPVLAGNLRPLVILEIAGGPSPDALNALIKLDRQGLLAGRTAQILIYDLDTDGPAFAAAMLKALRTGPLRDRDIALNHIPGNWSDRAALAQLVNGLPGDAVVAATSEGGLFEYGSDGDIVGVLEALGSRVNIVTGSVTRDGELNRLMRREASSNVIPRGLERFSALITPTGWTIARSEGAVLSDQVLLVRS